MIKMSLRVSWRLNVLFLYLHTHESIEKLKQRDISEIVEIMEKQNPTPAALSILPNFLSIHMISYIFSAILQ